MNKQISNRVRGILGGGLVLLLAAEATWASGFAVPEHSALGTGTANAVVANPEQTGAFAYNPAAMGFHDTSSIALGTVLVNPQLEVQTASGNHDSQNADWFALPIFQFALKFHEHWRLGIGVSAPFGLETRWAVGTFPKLSGTVAIPTRLPPPAPSAIPLPTGDHPTASKLEILAVTPTLVYKVNDDLSFSLGLDYYNAREAKLDSRLAKLDGDGDALGWNASLLYRHDAWSLGASFHSSATAEIGGWYSPLDPTLIRFGILKSGQSASLDLELPWRLQLGARYAFNAEIAVELDWTRTGWSTFDRVDIVGDSGGLITSDINEWKDASAYRLGLTYDIRPTTQLRLGYSYDETPQGDDHFSARAPDNDRHLFAIGIGQDLGQGWALEAAFMYAAVEERKIRSNAPYRRLGDDINGSDALDGDYNNSVNLLALEVRKAF